ncbi:MAG: tRNA modification GTPase, partial [Spirochaetales bacterium]|nr:tRNA modification GTPase [Spirochaetales bacterium]
LMEDISLEHETGIYDTDELIAALATPAAESAMAVIRTSGIGCIEAAARCFSRPERLKRAAHGSMVYGHITAPLQETTRETAQTESEAAETQPSGISMKKTLRKSSEQGRILDEVMAAVFRAPGGYTGQDSVEIYCHGSLPGIQLILEALRQAGFRDAAPGEFTMRAFLHGKMDLTQAEAIQEIVASKSKEAHALALHRLSGDLFKRIDGQKQRLLDIQSLLEVQLDYAEDEVAEDTAFPDGTVRDIRRELKQLADTYSIGKVYHQGLRIALAGRTNAGKSSLFNLFLKEDRSIVSDIHGTTRDYIESWITVRGIPVRLYDTAGFRFGGQSEKLQDSSESESEPSDLGLDAKQPGNVKQPGNAKQPEKALNSAARSEISRMDSVESEGIRRSERITETADLVIYLFDGEAGVSQDDRRVYREHQDDPRWIFVFSKSDLMKGTAGSDISEKEASKNDEYVFEESKMDSSEFDAFAVSARTGEGFPLLEEAVLKAASAGGDINDGVIIDSQRQKDLLESAVEALDRGLEAAEEGMPVDIIAPELQDALQTLGELTGEVTSDDVLNNIFAGFCVGK